MIRIKQKHTPALNLLGVLFFFTSEKVGSSHLVKKLLNFFMGQKEQTEIETRISAGWLLFQHIPADAPVYFKVAF